MTRYKSILGRMCYIKLKKTGVWVSRFCMSSQSEMHLMCYSCKQVHTCWCLCLGICFFLSFYSDLFVFQWRVVQSTSLVHSNLCFCIEGFLNWGKQRIQMLVYLFCPFDPFDLHLIEYRFGSGVVRRSNITEVSTCNKDIGTTATEKPGGFGQITHSSQQQIHTNTLIL